MTERLVASGCVGDFLGPPAARPGGCVAASHRASGCPPPSHRRQPLHARGCHVEGDGAIKSSVLGGVPARTDAPGTLYIAPMTTNQQILLWILLGIGGGMTYGRWRAERIRARHAMRATWEKRQDGRGGPTWKLW
jgi:hypothetical protein